LRLLLNVRNAMSRRPDHNTFGLFRGSADTRGPPPSTMRAVYHRSGPLQRRDWAKHRLVQGSQGSCKTGAEVISSCLPAKAQTRSCSAWNRIRGEGHCLSCWRRKVPDLIEVNRAWGVLPEPFQHGIVVMIRAAGRK
jgi:hypothetical protein